MPRICPHCRFPFDPDWGDDAIPAACPRCGEQLRATQASPAPGIATFLRVPASDAAVAETEPDVIAEIESHDDASVQEQSVEAVTADAATELAAASAPATVAAPATNAVPPPSFTRRSVEPATSRRIAAWQWLAFGVLLLALLLQLLLADRARLAAKADWRPLLATLCDTLHCELPPWREPQAFTMIERDVAPVAGTPAGLQVRATFRNDARWAQPWPRMQLSLADADGRIVGARMFEPREYLGKTPTALIASGQSAEIAFRIREPTTPAASFQFEFH